LAGDHRLILSRYPVGGDRLFCDANADQSGKVAEDGQLEGGWLAGQPVFLLFSSERHGGLTYM